MRWGWVTAVALVATTARADEPPVEDAVPSEAEPAPEEPDEPPARDSPAEQATLPDLCDDAALLAYLRTLDPDRREAEAKRLAEAASTFPPLALPTPAFPPRENRRALTPEPEYYGMDEPDSHLGLRFAPGAALRLGSNDPTRWAFSLDIAANARLGLGRGEPNVAFAPELGYWLLHRPGGDAGNPADSHLGSLGLGAALQYHNFNAGFQPRAAVGTTGDALTYGFRPAVWAAIGHGLIGIDLSYAALWVDGLLQHRLIGSVSIDVVPLLRAIFDNRYEREIFD